MNIYRLSQATGIIDLNNIEYITLSSDNDFEKLNSTTQQLHHTKEKLLSLWMRIDGNVKRITEITQLSEWIQIKNISQLIDMENKLYLLRKDRNNLMNILQINPSLELILPYINIESNLISFQTDLQQYHVQLVHKSEDIKKKIKQYKDEIGQLNSYKSNLQESANKIVAISTDKTHCPICKTQFDEYKLQKLINEISREVENIEKVQHLNEELESLNISMKDTKESLETLNIIMNCAKKLFDEQQIDILQIKDVVNKIVDSINNFNVIEEKIKELETIKTYLASIGATETEYARLLSIYNNEYSLKYGVMTFESLEKIKKNLIQENTSNYSIGENIENEIKSFEEIINTIKIKYNIFLEDSKEFLSKFSEKKKLIAQLNKEKKYLITYIHMQNFDVPYLIDNLTALLNLSKHVSEILIQNKKNHGAIQSLVNKLELNKVKHNVLKEKIEKLEFALSVINNLDKSNERLFDFFDNNMQSILNIFMKIHAPKEFDCLKFSDGNIELKRIGHDVFEPISRISTGQKSALALSIFLAMNRNAKNAPRYILFDDPVSNVDDINVLAFFDFLRDLALSGKRQIIFATASSKIANLFKKKFDFLDDKFKYYELKR